MPLELGKATKHRHHQLAVRSTGVGPTITQRPEASSALRNSGQAIQQITSGAGQPVELLVTSSVSPASSDAIQRTSAARSLLAPDCFSANTRIAPANVLEDYLANKFLLETKPLNTLRFHPYVCPLENSVIGDWLPSDTSKDNREQRNNTARSCGHDRGGDGHPSGAEITQQRKNYE